MFINLSNHSSINFTIEQYNAARTYGDVVDVSFPNIDPHASADEVDQLAQKTLNNILANYGNDCIIHVMGELNFCFSFVKYAKRANVKCVSSTTERNVIEKADGTKISQFHFVAFREYL